MSMTSFMLIVFFTHALKTDAGVPPLNSDNHLSVHWQTDEKLTELLTDVCTITGLALT
jgi:hypothetical protein